MILNLKQSYEMFSGEISAQFERRGDMSQYNLLLDYIMFENV